MLYALIHATTQDSEHINSNPFGFYIEMVVLGFQFLSLDIQMKPQTVHLIPKRLKIMKVN